LLLSVVRILTVGGRLTSHVSLSAHSRVSGNSVLGSGSPLSQGRARLSLIAPRHQARSADMPQAELTACLDLLECAGDAFPYTVVVPDDHAFFGHQAERRFGVRDDIVMGVRSVHEDEAGAAKMRRPVEGGGIAHQLGDAA